MLSQDLDFVFIGARAEKAALHKEVDPNESRMLIIYLATRGYEALAGH